MNRNEFLKELEKRLLYIPAEDRQDALEYYDEYISDMGLSDDDDVIEKLGTPKDVARNIIDECTQKHIEKVKEEKTVKNKATVLWLSILGVLSLPVSLPLAIAVIAIAFAFLMVIIALMFAAFVCSIAWVIGGVVALFIGILVPGFGQKILTFGVGLALLGAGLLFGMLITILTKSLISRIFKKRTDIKEADNE